MNASKELNTNWRRVASTIYKKPVDSKIFGEAELDITDLEKFVFEQRKAGLKITLTHIFVLIMARGVREKVPQFNCYIRRGRVVSRPSIDAMVSVLQADGNMGVIKVPGADKLNLSQLVGIMQDKIMDSRKGDEKGTNKKKYALGRIPWPFRNWVFSLYKTITLNWGITLPFLNVSSRDLGSFVISNIGSVGLDSGYPALLPSSNVAFVLVMGSSKKKPVVIQDELVIRNMMKISVVIDHRVADASHAGIMLRHMKYMIQHPEELL